VTLACAFNCNIQVSKVILVFTFTISNVIFAFTFTISNVSTYAIDCEYTSPLQNHQKDATNCKVDRLLVTVKSSTSSI
jgi:hypothetical protein